MNDINPLENWEKNIPFEIEKNLNIIKDICKKINSFDLIAYVSFYNHLQNPKEYTDYRGDKNFFVSEVVACQCLKNDYIENTNIDPEEVLEAFTKIQDATLKYCSLTDFSDMSGHNGFEDTFSEIMSKIETESKHVRNPGHPDHHLLFSRELFKPFEKQIESIFHFSLEDSLTIRDKISEFLNFKYQECIKSVEENASFHSKETIRYKNKKISADELAIKIENIDEIIKLSDTEIRHLYKNHFYSELMTNYNVGGTFDASELAKFLNLNPISVLNFLNAFSCTFNSITETEPIYSTDLILKRKPLVKHDDKYIIPSIPLLVWAVEEAFENEFKKNNKLYQKYISYKHDFLLKQAEIYFKNVLPNAQFYSNMFYGSDNKRCETDGLLIFNEYLFIIEAKANKLSMKAKAGHRLKTDDHLNDIIKNSYDQGIRTLNFLKENNEVIFQDKKKQKLSLKLANYREVVLVSLTLEQLGNIVPILKTDNNLNYFEKNHFPWIISIYDLVVINDFFETPSLLFSYLEIRKKFLSFESTYIYEELDLIGYFLKQKGNELSYLIEQEKTKGANYFYFEPETDYINNYYMHLFSSTNKYIKKPSYFTNNEFKELIFKIDKSRLNDGIKTSLQLMKFNKSAIAEISKRYKKVKKQFQKDKQLHDCSIFTKEQGGFGFTFMIAKDKNLLEEKLKEYIKYKKKQLFARTWVGVGEINGIIQFIITV